MKKTVLIFLASLFGLYCHAADEIQVMIRFDYPKTQLRIEMYEVQPSYSFSVARTAVVSTFAQVPAGRPLNMPFRIAENDSKTFILVLQNKTAKDKYFFANPHTYEPSHSSLDAIFECLCNHHVYKVPARSVWYRIVRVRFENENKKWKGKRKINLVHAVTEVPEEKALKEYRQILYEQIDSTESKK